MYLITYTGVQSNFHIWWCLCHLQATRWVPCVEQELTSYRKSWVHPLVFCGVVVAQCLAFFFVDHCLSYKCIDCLLAAIINVLSVFWFTASDFLFGIIKLLLADKSRNTSCKNYRMTQMTTTSYTASDGCSKHGIAPLQPTGDLNTELYRCSRQVI